MGTLLSEVIPAESNGKTKREEMMNLFDMEFHHSLLRTYIMKFVQNKILLLVLFGFLFLAFSSQPLLSEELDEDPSALFIVVLHPKVVPIEDSNGVKTVITLINLGNKPISLGRVDHTTGRMVGGDDELRVSVDISNAPLRHMQVGGLVTVSNDAPFTSSNLISGVNFMPGSGLWMAVTAVPTESLEVPEEGDAKFTVTLLSSVDGKIKNLIQMGFSMRYEKGRQSDDSRLIQANMELDKPNSRRNPSVSHPL